MQTKLDYNREQYNVVVQKELEEELKKRINVLIKR